MMFEFIKEILDAEGENSAVPRIDTFRQERLRPV